MYGRKTGKACSMKASLHPQGNQPLKQAFHYVRLPRTASQVARAKQWFINLYREWRASMSPEASDHLYRVGMTLLTLALIAGFGFLIWWTHANTYEVHLSNKTGQIVRIKDPTGKVVHLTDAEFRQIRNKDYIYVP